MSLSFLKPKDGPVLEVARDKEVVFAKDQPEYIPLRALKSKDRCGCVLSRWSPTEDQRRRISNGEDIFLQLMTYHEPLQPVVMYIATDTDDEEIMSILDAEDK